MNALVRTAVLATIAHELELTEVHVGFSNDGRFTIDVMNAPGWLLMRVEPFSGLGSRDGSIHRRETAGSPRRKPFDPPQTKVWEDRRDVRESPWSAGWEPPPIPPDNRWTVHATFKEQVSQFSLRTMPC